MTVLDGFDVVYRLHAGAVFRICLRAVSRREIAEEITSEVFLALHQNWTKLEPEQLPAWLFTVAKRRAADYWRHHYVEERWVVDQVEDTSWQEPEFNLDLLLTRCESLKPVHRICITLRFVHGMSRSEIAEQTQLTEFQAKGHLQYALQLLRDQMVPPTRTTAADAGELLPDAWF